MSDQFAIRFDNNDLQKGFVRSQSTIRIDKSIPVSEKYILRSNVGRMKKEKLEIILKKWTNLVAKSYFQTIHLSDKEAEFISDKSRVNSGSSANLLAFMALTSPLLKERKVERGDEVITVAAGFPTTIAPIVQYGAIPVFVDVEIILVSAGMISWNIWKDIIFRLAIFSEET